MIPREDTGSTTYLVKEQGIIQVGQDLFKTVLVPVRLPPTDFRHVGRPMGFESPSWDQRRRLPMRNSGLVATLL